MITSEWIAKARQHREKLVRLVEEWHPASQGKGNIRAARKKDLDLNITAPGAETACAVVRKQIAAKERQMGTPVSRLEDAIERGDVKAVVSLLNAAWFGVPESTHCWGIVGFREAVELLEDPPEDEDNSNG